LKNKIKTFLGGALCRGVGELCTKQAHLHSALACSRGTRGGH
jgi:hypothetical protein